MRPFRFILIFAHAQLTRFIFWSEVCPSACTHYRTTDSGLRFVAQKNSVTWAALFQAGADAMYLDVKSTFAQPLLEFSILLGRPNGQHSVLLESCAGSGYSTLVIKHTVFRSGKRGWPVIHVE